MRREQGYDPGPNRQARGGGREEGAVSIQVEEQQIRVSDELHLPQHQICHLLNIYYAFHTSLVKLMVLTARFCCRYAASPALRTSYAKMGKAILGQETIVLLHLC